MIPINKQHTDKQASFLECMYHFEDISGNNPKIVSSESPTTDSDHSDDPDDPDDPIETDEVEDNPLNLSDDEEEPGDPIARENTRLLKSRLSGPHLTDKVKKILTFMNSQGLNLPIFLDALSWGDAGCHSDPKVQYERTALMVSDELPGILERWHNLLLRCFPWMASAERVDESGFWSNDYCETQ